MRDDFELQKEGSVEAAVNRVERYIQEHLDDELVVSDLAAVAGVSVRTIFRKFRSHGRGSPMKVLAAARLQEARRRLLEGGPHDTVSRVASDSGFTHLSRFSGLYKKTYGEPPSETLRRAQRRRRGDRFRGLAVGSDGRLPISMRAHSSHPSVGQDGA